MKRKKKLEKGIKSIEQQIEIHKQKKKQAEEENRQELADYYGREILSLESQKKKKKEQLEKQ